MKTFNALIVGICFLLIYLIIIYTVLSNRYKKPPKENETTIQTVTTELPPMTEPPITLPPIEPPKYNIPFESNSCRLTQRYTTDTFVFGEGHIGYDLVDTTGENKIVSLTDGVVSFAGKGTGGYSTYGNYVEIQYDGKRFYYAHMEKVCCEKGDIIKAGDFIGIMGDTGYAFGKHLHLSIRHNTSGKGKYINPYEYTAIPNEIGTYTNKEVH